MLLLYVDIYIYTPVVFMSDWFTVLSMFYASVNLCLLHCSYNKRKKKRISDKLQSTIILLSLNLENQFTKKEKVDSG